MNALARAAAMMTEPAAAWARIEKAADDPAFLLTRYVAVLALIPALSTLIGACAIGVIAPGIGVVRAPLLDGLLGALFSYVAACAIVMVLAVIIRLLAPAFGGEKSFENAFTLAAYAYTPVWLAGIFLLLPGLHFLTLGGFYGAYLLALGLPRLMKSSADKAPRYAGLIVLCAAALTLAAAIAQQALFGPHAP